MIESLRATKFSIVFYIISTLLFTCFVFADPYCPDNDVLLESKGTEQNNESGDINLSWKIVPKQIENAFVLSFFKDLKPYAKVKIEESEKGKRSIKLLNLNKTIIHQSDNAFLPISGFFIPFHMIDPDATRNDKNSYKITQSAGSRVFSKIYIIDRQPLSIEQAIENNWIAPEYIDTEEKEESLHLILYTITNENGTFLFKQLWNKDESWWLYEETATHKTWKRQQ